MSLVRVRINSLILVRHASSEAPVPPGGEEQGDFISASENQRSGREAAHLQRQRQPSEEEKILVYLEANKLLTHQLCRGTKSDCPGGRSD